MNSIGGGSGWIWLALFVSCLLQVSIPVAMMLQASWTSRRLHRRLTKILKDPDVGQRMSRLREFVKESNARAEAMRNRVRSTSHLVLIRSPRYQAWEATLPSAKWVLMRTLRRTFFNIVLLFAILLVIIGINSGLLHHVTYINLANVVGVLVGVAFGVLVAVALDRRGLNKTNQKIREEVAKDS